jgi:hypothetical protein
MYFHEVAKKLLVIKVMVGQLFVRGVLGAYTNFTRKITFSYLN